jgi:hypothetical protein
MYLRHLAEVANRFLTPAAAALAERERLARLEALTDYKAACEIEGVNCVDSDFGAEELDRRIAALRKPATGEVSDVKA